MRITWVARSFLDYRIPVYAALDELCGHQLTLIYNSDKVPERCEKKVKEILGDRAIPLRKEYRLRSKSSSDTQLANVGFSIPYHPDLIKTVRNSNPDVLISDGFLKWTYSTLFVRAFNKNRIKHIMCYERTPHTERNAGVVRTIYRKIVCRWIDAIDCNGSLTQEYVVNTLGYKKPITYGHMAADTKGMASNVANTTDREVNLLREKYGLKDLTFVYVGRIIPLKGIMELLRAWKIANLTGASLMLVGDGPLRDEAESFIRDNEIKDVIFTGGINYDNLGAYYKAAGCFIIPTLEDNWSLVVPEAMASGLPVACSIYNGCYPELVRPENGWTFDPLDINQTAETLIRISENRGLLKEMGEESKRIVANYTPQKAAEALYKMCETLKK